MLLITKKALEEFDNQHDFERMVADILHGLGYKDVTLIAPKGGGDGRRDITFTTESGGKGLACVTLRADSDKKFHEDFSQRKKGEFEKHYFFTNQYLTANQKKKYIRYCLDNLDSELVTQDIEALRSLLDSSLKSTRKRFLHIDDSSSGAIRKQITKILKYPATLSPTNFQDRINLVERRITQPLHREIYYFIIDIDDAELQEVPLIGKTLITFKEIYYNFCLIAKELAEKSRKIISTQTATHFQFIHGWCMLFDYFLARCFGLDEHEAQQSVSLNYGITFGMCEQVFKLLRSTPEIDVDINAMQNQLNSINAIIAQLIEEINRGISDDQRSMILLGTSIYSDILEKEF